MIKECELCGDEFEAKRKDARFCYKDHMRNCIVCGEEFKIKLLNKPAVTCSRSCVGKYVGNPSLYMDEYVDNRSLNERELCGDVFEAKRKDTRFCYKDHMRNCIVCGKKFKIKSPNRPPVTCSQKCVGKYVSNSSLYSNEYEDNRQKHLKECELCGDKFEAKREYSRFCYKDHMRNCIVCGKEFKVIVLGKPAVTCSQSCVGKYSRNPSLYVNEYEDNRQKYLKECEFCGDEFETHNNKKKYCNKDHEKNCEICGDTFIVDSVTQIYCNKQHFKECEVCGTEFEIVQNHRPGKVCSFRCVARIVHMQYNNDPDNYEDWINFKEFAIKTNYDCYQLSKYFNMPINSIKGKAHKENATGFVKDFYSYSIPELEVKHMLINLGLKEGVDFIPNDRTLIRPLELDFYMPEHKIAIEVSPTHTHNSKYDWAKKTAGLDKYYHYEKFKACEDNDVNLITLFDWQDFDLFKLTVSTLTNKSKTVNNCKIAYKHNDNSIHLSLEDQKLIEASFDNKNNMIINTNNINKSFNKHELIYLLLKKYSHVSKHDTVQVEVDLSMGNKNIYQKVGFKTKKIIEPKLHYAHSTKDIYINPNELKNKNIEELELQDILPIYDCGHELLELDLRNI